LTSYGKALKGKPVKMLVILKDYSNRNLQKVSFANEDLRYCNFSNSDLRGADLTGANLNGVDFTGVKTGIIPINVVWMFILAMIISLFSGYMAMLGGTVVQALILSKHEHERMAGTLSVMIIALFIVYAWQKGGSTAFKTLIVPIIVFAVMVAVIIYLSGVGSGKGIFYLGISLLLTGIMLITGTIARTIAGSISNIYFLIVAFSGELFSKSIGGGIGTIILAILCALISKRAVGGAAGFDLLKNIALFVTRKYGTSFRNAKMANARFSGSKLRNIDFSYTDVSLVNWGNARRINCIIEETIVTDKKK